MAKFGRKWRTLAISGVQLAVSGEYVVLNGKILAESGEKLAVCGEYVVLNGEI